MHTAGTFESKTNHSFSPAGSECGALVLNGVFCVRFSQARRREERLSTQLTAARDQFSLRKTSLQDHESHVEILREEVNKFVLCVYLFLRPTDTKESLLGDALLDKQIILNASNSEQSSVQRRN